MQHLDFQIITTIIKFVTMNQSDFPKVLSTSTFAARSGNERSRSSILRSRASEPIENSGLVY